MEHIIPKSIQLPLIKILRLSRRLEICPIHVIPLNLLASHCRHIDGY